MSGTMTLTPAGLLTGGTLRSVLALDAATGLGMGLVLLAAATPLSAWLGLPAGLLVGAGVVLLGFAALLGGTAAMRRPAAPLVWLVIAGNVGWVIASGLVAFVLFTPTTLGLAFVLFQAMVVGLLTWLEHRALSRQGA